MQESLVDGPLRKLTEHYLGSGMIHGLKVQSMSGEEESVSVDDTTSLSESQEKEQETAAQVLAAITALAAAYKPTLEDLQKALEGKVPPDVLQKFLSQAKSRGLAEAKENPTYWDVGHEADIDGVTLWAIKQGRMDTVSPDWGSDPQ